MRKWHLGILWLGAHFLLAAILVLTIVDEFELIDQTAMPAICEDYIEGRAAKAFPTISFAANCWHWPNVLDFFLLDFAFATFLLSPFTITKIISIRSKRREDDPELKH